MKRKTSPHLLGLVVVVTALAIVGCEGDQGPAGPAGVGGAAGPTGPTGQSAALTCTECHVESDLITGKQTQWSESLHGAGTSYGRGTSTSCAGCHSGSAFTERITAGLDPDELAAGDPDPTRQDCRACHVIHTTYTMADFALTTTSAVSLYAIEGATFDGGEGNLCVNCHQARREIPAAVGGVISGINSHWGPHHGPQSSMLLGIGGAGDVTGTASPHYSLVEDTCVHCHMGEGNDHHFEPDVDNCLSCHPSATSFDINEVQTDVVALADSLGAMLVTAGLIDENTADGHPIVTEAPEAQAIALWNWIYVAHEDQSKGVHNSTYTKALLEAGLEAMATPLP